MGLNTKSVGIALILCLLALTATGCWDRVELEDRMYAFSAGLDLAKRTEAHGGEESAPGRYRLAAEVALWEALSGGGGAAQGGPAGAGGPKPYWLLVSTADTLARAVEQYEKQASRTISWSHLSVIVVGEPVAREGLMKPLDYFVREREMQRRVKLVVARAEAKPVLEVNPKVDKIVGFYLPRVLSLASRQNNRSIDMTLGEFVSRVDPEMGFLVPRVRPSQETLVVAGLAAFRGDKLIGWLGEEETKGATVLIGKCAGGIVEVTSQAGRKVAYRSRDARVKWKPHVEGEKVSFTVDISLNGDLEEVEASLVDVAAFTAMSQGVAAEFKKQLEAAIAASKRLRSDIFQTGRIIKGRYPGLWQRKLHDGWNDHYADEVDVKVGKVKVTINHVGQRR